MGKIELHKGTLVKIDTGNLTIEQYCEYICLKNKYKLLSEDSTYAETLIEIDNTYMILNNELYRSLDTKVPNETPYFVDIKHLEYGILTYVAQFDVDITSLEKTLEDGLSKIRLSFYD